MNTERDELAEVLWDLALRHLGIATSSSKQMADELLAAGYRKSSVTSELESLADFFDEMASLSSYSQPSAVTEAWLEAAKYARARIAA